MGEAKWDMLAFFCGVFSNWCIFVLQALTRASLTIPNTLYTPSPTQVSALSVRCVLFFPGGWGGAKPDAKENRENRCQF